MKRKTTNYSTHQPISVKALTPFIKKAAKENDTDIAETVRDILTDLRHFCDFHKLDFAELDKGANDVYTEEFYEDCETKRLERLELHKNQRKLGANV